MKIRFEYGTMESIRHFLSKKFCVNAKGNKCYGGTVILTDEDIVTWSEDGKIGCGYGRPVFAIPQKNSKSSNEFWQKYKYDCFYSNNGGIFMEEYFDDFSEAILTSEISSVIEHYCKYSPRWAVKGKEYTHLLVQQGNGFRMNKFVFDTINQQHVGHSRIFGAFDPSQPSTEIVLDYSDFAGRKIDVELFLWENGISLPETAAGED